MMLFAKNYEERDDSFVVHRLFVLHDCLTCLWSVAGVSKSFSFSNNNSIFV